MTLKTSTLRPGILVSLKTSIKGNVSYDKRIIESERIVKGVQKVKWETERTIVDPKEHAEAILTRSKVRNTISAVCAKSDFGLLCLQSEADLLEAAMTEARAFATEFNKTAKRDRISVYVLTGRIAQDDIEAIRSMNSELNDLIERMQEGVENVDADVIRDAANRVTSISKMLTDEAQQQAKIATDAARKVARVYTKAKKKGEKPDVDKSAAIVTMTKARTMFLEIEETEEPVVTKSKKKARKVHLEAEA